MTTTRRVIGVDEVGRGSLAGPVVSAAVVLPEYPYPWIEEIRDSKKLTPKKREELAGLILHHSIYAIREGSAFQIDEVNILQATLWTMKKCVGSVCEQLGEEQHEHVVLVDGTHKIPNLELPQEAIKGGDNVHKAIGAASIVAKVYRDHFMETMSCLYPEYGFAKHKGYGTAEHREAIMVHGPCPIHRRTFKGVYEYVKSPDSGPDYS
jgi:ribonuclease HII